MKNRRHARRTSRSKRNERTFRDILKDTRPAAARAAWDRAVSASHLRHLARGRAAAVLEAVTLRAVTRALQIAPDLFRITIVDEYQVGLVSVVWSGGARLHLPADARIGACRRRSA